MGDYEDAETRLPEFLRKGFRDGILEIVPDLLFPNLEALAPKIEFEECRGNAGESFKFKVRIRNKANAGGERLREETPPTDRDAVNRLRLKRAVNVVHGELVLHEEVAHERRVMPPLRPAFPDAHICCPFGREGLERLRASGARAEEEPFQHARLCKGEKPCIHPRGRSECGNDLRLVTADHPQL